MQQPCLPITKLGISGNHARSFLCRFALLAVLGLSLLVGRLRGRSRKEMRKPGWYVVFFLLFLPAGYFVYTSVAVNSPFLYAAYAIAGGFAALVAQALFGAKLANDNQRGNA